MANEGLAVAGLVIGSAALLGAGVLYATKKDKAPSKESTGALSERPSMTPNARFAPYIDKGLVELVGKKLQQIQIETALTWTGRACAAAIMDNYEDAREYAHEGLEHAALSSERGLVDEVRAQLDKYGIQL